MSLLPHHSSDPVCALCTQKLALVHPDLHKWYVEQIKPIFHDSHISWGFRDAADQEIAVEDGKSKLEFPQSAHNKTPAMALDLFQIDEAGHAKWDPGYFSVINQLCAKINAPIIWGGIWKGLGDNDHFQLKLPD